ncbi:pyridoxamine 5'-phosphate oxidase family protein [Pricia sp.]|uniref:pyridoxamine 5'-phosphate oxidase family protein n=1 Tax=Pricia sp. TaxID=2268138 RepID=UPI003593A001
MEATENENTTVKNMETLECLQLLDENYIGRLAYISWGTPHINPITYYHDAEEKCILSYSAPGYKIEAMEKHGSVAFQVDDIRSIQQWRSVLVQGRFEQLEGSTAKMHLHRFAEGVQRTIAKKEGEAPKFIKDFSSHLQEREIPIVYRIHIKDIVGKFRED